MKKIFLFATLFCLNLINAQQLVRDNLNAGFQESTNGIGVIGEVFNQYNANSNIIIETILDITNATLSTTEFNGSNQIKVYPNPTNDLVNIQFKSDFKGNYVLFDQLGKQILTHPINSLQTQISLEKYASGIYFLVLNSENGNQVQTYQILKK